MLRVTLPISVLVAILALPTVVLANEADEVSSGGDRLVGGIGSGLDAVDVEGGSSPGVDDAPRDDAVAPVSDEPSGPPPPTPVAFEPFWSTQDGQPCILLVGVPGVAADSTTAYQWEQETGGMFADPRLLGIAPADRYCAGSNGQAMDNPMARARSFARSIPLPHPQPVIAPGVALTGLPAYLVAEQQAPFTESTDIDGFGRLQVEFSPVGYTVEWGDGAVTTLEAGEFTIDAASGRLGVPWAERASGTPIRHIYTDRNPDVVVRLEARWTAELTLPGFPRQSLTGLQVRGSVDLPVQEYRAVRLTPGS